jgi:predicted Holliday junction resolvase-like endonuclease
MDQNFFLVFWLISCIILLIILYNKLSNVEKAHQSLIREHQQQLDTNLSLKTNLEAVSEQSLQSQQDSYSSITLLQEELADSKLNYKSLLSQKKSSEVRLGNIAEKLAPFLDYFSFDPECAHFLGQPIDYVVFEDDLITFVEIKSGKSQLSSKQRHIRDLINNKQVAWKEIRIK